MCQDELCGPDLAGVVADADAVILDYVVIGAFAVIYHGYVRATKDSDLLAGDGPEADGAVLRFLERIDGRHLRDNEAITPEDITSAESLRVNSRHGIVDLMRAQLPPLDYGTVAMHAETVESRGQTMLIASLRSLVAFKRLARRPHPEGHTQDRLELSEREATHGPLPVEPIPALDT